MKTNDKKKILKSLESYLTDFTEQGLQTNTLFMKPMGDVKKFLIGSSWWSHIGVYKRCDIFEGGDCMLPGVYAAYWKRNIKWCQEMNSFFLWVLMCLSY